MQTLAESWDGKTWSNVPSPNNGSNRDELTGVSCVSSTFYQAVGQSSDGSGISQTLIESWTRKAGTISPSVNTGANGNWLSGISCVSATACKAVGSFSEALVARRSRPAGKRHAMRGPTNERGSQSPAKMASLSGA